MNQVGPSVGFESCVPKIRRIKEKYTALTFIQGLSISDHDEAVSVIISGRSQRLMTNLTTSLQKVILPKNIHDKIVAAVKQRVQIQASKARFLKSRMNVPIPIL